jgi:hypothetical protein
VPQGGPAALSDLVSSNWLKSLNPFAVAFRYDDTEPSGLDTAALLEIVHVVRKWAGETVG